MGWKVNLWARLLDGNHALKLITDQLTLVDPVAAGRNGGTYPNFFDAHPPFQIDGNFGCTSGIAEMLMQSHDGAISILPALPDAWKDGDISGLRTQGGFEVQFEWKDAQVVKLSIKSNLGGNCRIRLAHKMTLKNGKSLSKAKGENPNIFFQVSHVKAPIISSKAKTESVQQRASFLYDLPTKAGETYELILK